MNSIIPIVEESNRLLAEAIKHFGLTVPAENIVVTVQSKGRKNALGWFWHGRWNSELPGEAKHGKKLASEGSDLRQHLHEINLCAEHLRDSDMGEVLIHELAHAENDHQGIKDCAGRRHNKKFKVMAERLGLEVEKSGSLGFAFTKLAGPAEAFLKKIAFKREVFQLSRLGEGSKKSKPGSRLVKVECPECGYVIRTTQKWIDQGVPTCACGTEMGVA